MNDIDQLIERGNALRGTGLGSARYEVWANDVRAIVKPFGDSMMKILEDGLHVGVVIMGGPNFNDDNIDAAIELLSVLKERSPEESRMQDALINQKAAEARATVRSKFGDINIKGDFKGDFTFGDNSPINKLTVGELMSGIINDIEGMPESVEKKNMLQSLKSVLANPTFASVSGAAIGEVVKRLIGVQQ